jgi:hypothetical protein
VSRRALCSHLVLICVFGGSRDASTPQENRFALLLLAQQDKSWGGVASPARGRDALATAGKMPALRMKRLCDPWRMALACSFDLFRRLRSCGCRPLEQRFDLAFTTAVSVA